VEIVFVTLLIGVVVLLLVTEWIPVDLTALGIPVVLMISQVLTPTEALAGFSNAAPLTVGALFIVSRGLMRTGALDFFTQKLIDITRGRSMMIMVFVLFLTGLFSAVLNNTPVVLLFISILMAVCCKYSLSPSKFLIPVSFISILAGTSTLIGTSTNIIVSDLGVQMGCRPIGMFELGVVGLPLTILGGIFIGLVAQRWLPGHKLPVCEIGPSRRRKYLSELTIYENSPWVGKTIQSELKNNFEEIELFEVFRGNQTLAPEASDIQIAPNDVLLVKAPAEDLVEIVNQGFTKLTQSSDGKIADPRDQNAVLAELIVPPNSSLIGVALKDTVLAAEKNSHFLGVLRRKVHHSGKQIEQLRLSLGDILLVQCSSDRLEQLKHEGDLMVLDDMSTRIINRKKAPIALVLFAAMIGLATSGLLSILIASLAAAFLMILTGCLRLRTAYKSVDVPVLLLIIGTLALGQALIKTGAADLYSSSFLSLFDHSSPRVVLSLIILLTSLLSHFLSNNSTAVLMVPIALSTASALGVDPRPFIIGICFGASACFASPFGYQTNLLVYSPGGYKFTDYIKLGMPLNLMVWGGASLLIPHFWPF
jgi:di/tricarboxylate transporter